jgi:hypothetical protein
MTEQPRISLTYQLGGEHLARPGVYISADVEVKNPFKEHEVIKVRKPLEVLEEPIIKKATVNITLSNEFYNLCLVAPHKPPYMSIERWLSTRKGKLSRRWHELSELQKIDLNVGQYVQDMNGGEYSFTII